MTTESNSGTPFDKTKTVATMDEWTNYMVEKKATPLMIWGMGEEDEPVCCFASGLLDMPFGQVLELLLGMDMVEDEV